MATVSANKLELLQIAEAVAREKAIDRKIVLGAMEDAIAKAARSRYGSETEVRAEIDPKSGELHLSRHMLVVEPWKIPRPRSASKKRGVIIPRRRSATPSPISCRRSNMAASPRNRPSR